MTASTPQDPPPRNPQEFLAMVRGTPYEALFRDEAKLDAMMFDLMKQSRDPLAREVGAALSDGSLTVRQLADSDVYSEVVRGGLEAAAGLDPRGALEAVVAEREAAQAADPGDRRPGASGRRDTGA